jgi:hypothetical protein
MHFMDYQKKGVRIIQDNLNIKIKFYENNRDFYERFNIYKYDKEDKNEY